MNGCSTPSPLFRSLFAAGLALAVAGPAGAAAKSRAQAADAPLDAAPARAEAGPNCKGEAARPAQLSLQVGKSSLMRLPEPVQHRSVGNPLVVQALMVAPDTLYIAGVDVGTTNMIIQGKSGLCSVLDITVAMDPSALQATLAAALPDENDIKVLAAADALVLTGTAYRTPRRMEAGDLNKHHKHLGTTGYEWLSRDDRVAAAFAADPLTFDAKVLKLFGVADGMRLYGRPARGIRDLPLLVMIGEEDSLGGPASARMLVAAYESRSGFTDTSLVVYPGARHEVFNETNRAEVFGDLVRWLDARFPTRA